MGDEDFIVWTVAAHAWQFVIEFGPVFRYFRDDGHLVFFVTLITNCREGEVEELTR